MRNIYDFYITPEEYDIAERNGISNKLLYYRIRRDGWSKERAMSQPVRKRSDYSKWYLIAEKNGISRRTFLMRMYNCGWDCERAATEPIKSIKEKVILMAESRRKYSDKIYETLKLNGISRTMFYGRIHRGWTIERAMTEKKNYKRDTSSKRSER